MGREAALTGARTADGWGSDGQNPRRAALAVLGWPVRRLALLLGEHPVTVSRFVDGGKDLPGVEAWLALISAPLRRWPSPQASDLHGPKLVMDGAELRAARGAMRWTRRDVGVRTARTDADILSMEEDQAPVDDLLARWMRRVSGPILAHPLPEGWEPRHAFVALAPGRSALPQALPDSPRRRELQARVAAEQKARQERPAKQAERERLRQEGEERRRAVQEERRQATQEQRRQLAAEHARRAAELDDGLRTVEEIGRELGISHQAVSRLRKVRRGERGRAAPDPAIETRSPPRRRSAA